MALPEATTTLDVQPIAFEETDPAPVEAETQLEPPAQTPRKSRTRRTNPAPAEAETQLEPPAQTSRKSRTRRAATSRSFDPKKLLPDFRGHSLQTALQIVLAQEPDRSFGTDDLLMQLYGEFAEAELSKGRRSLGKVLSIGAKAGLWQRVQDKPPLYQAVADSPSSASELEERSQVDNQNAA